MALSAESTSPLALPRWQVQLVLIGFPLLYLANSFTPWSYRLFVERDHRYFLAFAISICVLHWASVAIAVWFLWQRGGKLADIGFFRSFGGFLLFVLIVVAAGTLLILYRQQWPEQSPAEPTWQLIYPWTLRERIFAVLLYLTAGFCEELVYRGWAIRVLQAKGWRTWQAIGLASVAFILAHGVAGIFLFPIHLPVAILLSLLFLWRRSVVPGMYLHALFDMMSLLAI